jgi:hypothetical protein
MDPVAQLHSAQQGVFEALDLGTWSDVGRATSHLIELEQRCLQPTARRVGLSEEDLDPGLSRHVLWIGLMRCADHAAWREQLRSSLIEHVAWTGTELLAPIYRRLGATSYQRLGMQMDLVTRRSRLGEAA